VHCTIHLEFFIHSSIHIHSTAFPQRCSPRGSCLSWLEAASRQFSACLALALPRRPSGICLGLARPHNFCVCLGSVSKVLDFFVSLLCDYKIGGMISIYHYCGFVYTTVSVNTARRELECLIFSVFCMKAKRYNNDWF